MGKALPPVEHGTLGMEAGRQSSQAQLRAYFARQNAQVEAPRAKQGWWERLWTRVQRAEK